MLYNSINHETLLILFYIIFVSIKTVWWRPGEGLGLGEGGLMEKKGGDFTFNNKDK